MSIQAQSTPSTNRPIIQLYFTPLKILHPPKIYKYSSPKKIKTALCSTRNKTFDAKRTNAGCKWPTITDLCKNVIRESIKRKRREMVLKRKLETWSFDQRYTSIERKRVKLFESNCEREKKPIVLKIEKMPIHHTKSRITKQIRFNTSNNQTAKDMPLVARRKQKLSIYFKHIKL